MDNKKSDTQLAGFIASTYVGLAGVFGKSALELTGTPNEAASPYLALLAIGCLIPTWNTVKEHAHDAPQEFAKGMIIPILAMSLVWGKIKYEDSGDLNDIFSDVVIETSTLEPNKD